MNKILKRLVGLFIIGIGILNICDAGTTYENYLGNNRYIDSTEKNLTTSYTNIFNYNDLNQTVTTGAGTYCMKFTTINGTAQTLTMGFANGPTTTPSNLYTLYNDQYGKRVCLYGNKPYLNAKLNSSSNTVEVYIFNFEQTYNGLDLPIGEINIDLYEQYTKIGTETIINGQTIIIPQGATITTGTRRIINCPECEECQECQTCPTIDAQYCMNNFNLIPPAYCPICGTGDINWSSLYINGTQYNSNEIIDIHTEEQMQTDIDYLNDTVDIDISYGQDEEYIENIIAQEKLTPTNEDFEKLMYIVGEFIPYLFITLLIFFFVKIIKKIWK